MKYYYLINRFKSLFPPNKNWKYQKQTQPPTFGWAKLVSYKILNKEIYKRLENCEKVIKESKNNKNIQKSKVALIVLSCKRLKLLQRLASSMQAFFSKIENYTNIEKILVDNGSGEELVNKIKEYKFFDKIISHKENLGMVGALKKIYKDTNAEYIILVEDDFILDYDKPFIDKCLEIFDGFPEIGIIRLKNQNNWWKPHRVIGPIRKSKNGTEFWTWLPSKDYQFNVWCAGSVMFRKISYTSVGELPEVVDNPNRKNKLHQGTIYECIYGQEYNRLWLAAKIKDCYPFIQPNDNLESKGWSIN